MLGVERGRARATIRLMGYGSSEMVRCVYVQLSHVVPCALDADIFSSFDEGRWTEENVVWGVLVEASRQAVCG
jgi:hypothetical protein